MHCSRQDGAAELRVGAEQSQNRRKVKKKENINLKKTLILEQGNYWQPLREQFQ